ncbi:MAG: hypothetical protein AAF830_13970 [Pseudomonadota bacterium]
MLSIIRDLPDWVSGSAVAVGVWGVICYSTLAPRVLEQEIDTKVTPSCVAALRTQEKGAIDAKIARMKEAAEYDLAQERRRLESEDRRLASVFAEAKAVEMATEMFNDSALGQLIDIPTIPSIGSEAVEKKRSAIRDELSGLKLPEFHILPVPDAEVLNTCACATADAIGGQQTAIAIHLASFRIWTPDEIKTLGSDVTKVLAGNQCGPKPWESRV